MTDYLLRALKQLGASEGEVLAHSLTDTEIVIVLDKGIKGCPKYRIPLNTLQGPEVEPPVEDLTVEDEEIVETAEDVEAAVEPSTADNLDDLSYRDLQAMAKDYDIPANQSKDDLIDALSEVV